MSTDKPALFAVPPSIDASGMLTSTPAPDAGGTATVTVWLQDSDGTANEGRDASAVQTFTITVHAVAQDPPVQIDVKHGPINLATNGVITVRLLGTATFDATQVDAHTVLFAGAAPLRSRLADVDGDGDLDLVLKFRTQDAALWEIYGQLLVDADPVVEGRLVPEVSRRSPRTAESRPRS